MTEYFDPEDNPGMATYFCVDVPLSEDRIMEADLHGIKKLICAMGLTCTLSRANEYDIMEFLEDA